MADDPREAGGRMIHTGDPHARDAVLFDMRRAVLVEEIETAVAHTTSNGRPGPDAVALTIHGRINRPPDDAAAVERPKEQVTHLHMMGWDGAADLVTDILSLAARDGFPIGELVTEKVAAARKAGLFEKASK